MELRGTMRVNEKGHLEIGGCDAVALAAEFGTPLYVYDEAALRERCRAYLDAFAGFDPPSRVIYAGKAFLTMAMCKIVEEEGLGLDVVSGGELHLALQAGFPPDRIYFHGNNKSPQEIRGAVEAGVGRIVIDALEEVRRVDEAAAAAGRRVQVLLRLTPGVEAHTHDYMRTGQIDSKFGLSLRPSEPGGHSPAMEAVRMITSMPRLELLGVHAHIGSQISDVEPFEAASRVLFGFMAEVRRETGIALKELNLGGGAGVRYTADDARLEPRRLAEVVHRAVSEEARRRGMTPPQLAVEPGRSIAGEAGTTLYRAGVVKEIPGVRTYLAVDGGMTDNPRVALYRARYEAALANKMNRPKTATYTIAGKCCESGDMLVWDVELPEAEPGDIVAVAGTGAYNHSMASNYNRLPRPAVVLVCEGQADCIVERETYDDLIRKERVPERLKRPQAQQAAAAGEKACGTLG